MTPLALIDTSAIVYRAYHALPPTSRDVLPTAVANTLQRIVDDGEADRFLVFDGHKRGKSWRNRLFKGYKAARAAVPPEIKAELISLRALPPAGFRPCMLRGHEADDWIASFTVDMRARGLPVRVYSIDKDLLPLIAHGAEIYKGPGQVITAADVMHKFGVLPAQIPDLLALMGDAADGIPGVPGIGQVTAARLLNEHDSIDALLDPAHLVPRYGARLRFFEKLIRRNLRLVTLRTDLRVP